MAKYVTAGDTPPRLPRLTKAQMEIFKRAQIHRVYVGSHVTLPDGRVAQIKLRDLEHLVKHGALVGLGWDGLGWSYQAAPAFRVRQP